MKTLAPSILGRGLRVVESETFQPGHWRVWIRSLIPPPQGSLAGLLVSLVQLVNLTAPIPLGFGTDRVRSTGGR